MGKKFSITCIGLMCLVLASWAISEVWCITLYFPPTPNTFVIVVYSGLGRVLVWGGEPGGGGGPPPTIMSASEMRKSLNASWVGKDSFPHLTHPFYYQYNADNHYHNLMITTPHWFWASLFGGLALLPAFTHLGRNRDESTPT